jgi:hypothetical protein
MKVRRLKKIFELRRNERTIAEAEELKKWGHFKFVPKIQNGGFLQKTIWVKFSNLQRHSP